MLWPEVVRGDIAAWRRLVLLYASLVLVVVRRAGLDHDDAEDCAQQTWIALFRKRHSITSPKAIPAWLIQTAHRKALTSHRNRARRAELNQQAPSPAQDRLPDEQVTALQEAAILNAAYSQLDKRCQKLLGGLFLSDTDDTYEQIARNLRVKLNSIGPIRSRCLLKLKKNLNRLGYDAD